MERGERCGTPNIWGGAAAKSCQEHTQPPTSSLQHKSLPFIYKLLEILRENSIRQLGRRLQREGERVVCVTACEWVEEPACHLRGLMSC